MEAFMAKKKSDKSGTVSIDGKDYVLDELSNEAKEQIASLQFVEQQIQQLQNEWAVSDTARIGYSNAIKKEVEKT
jgi:hypothetical protein